jgi:hypothetical protein
MRYEAGERFAGPGDETDALQEPIRLGRRYFTTNKVFIALLARELLLSPFRGRGRGQGDGQWEQEPTMGDI